MDLEKIGKFILKARQDKNMTQKDLRLLDFKFDDIWKKEVINRLIDKN